MSWNISVSGTPDNVKQSIGQQLGKNPNKEAVTSVVTSALAVFDGDGTVRVNTDGHLDDAKHGTLRVSVESI